MKWLRLTEPRMRGPEVTRLQEILMALGYDIGSTGCDGIFGPDTSNAVKMLQRRHGLISDGAVGNLETWPFLQDLWRVQVRKNPVSATKITLVDRRGLHEPPRLYRKDLSPRPWSGEGQTVIRGVTLHQTGCILSEYPRMYDLGNFHIVILQNGTIILVNPFEWFIWHANDLSFATIGIEFHGNMPGIHDRPETVWNEGAEPNDLTDAQIRAADLLFGWLQHQFQINGGKWEFVYAHRQASKHRRADPGSEIWQKVGLKWIKWLEATDGGPDFQIEDGLPIPKQWNPDYTADY